MKESLQKLFDKALEAVSGQGSRSVRAPGSGQCRYRGHQGLKCAIGHLLTDEQMEKFSITEMVVPELFPKELLEELAPSCDHKKLTEFLYELRSAHDGAPDSENFQASFLAAMKRIAYDWRLKSP